jgi:hypothetical protein
MASCWNRRPRSAISAIQRRWRRRNNMSLSSRGVYQMNGNRLTSLRSRRATCTPNPNRQRCFFESGDYERYLAELREITTREGCAVHAYVLMTNVHLLMTPTAAGQRLRLLRKTMHWTGYPPALRVLKLTTAAMSGRGRGSGATDLPNGSATRSTAMRTCHTIAAAIQSFAR